MDLTFLYVHGSEIGYGRTGVYIAEELRKRGVTLWDDDGRPAELDERKSAGKQVTTGRQAAPSPTNAVCWVSVPTHASGWFEGQHKSILTMWESMRLPESFRETIHEFDLVMVPSYQNVELFSKYHPNVQLVLLGVDGDRWQYAPPPPVTNQFTFLISGRGSRKGVDLAFQAFKEVFHGIGDDRPRPRLVMKSMKGHGDYYSTDVEHITGKLSADEELALYRSAHCYVQPSRGEGFGLQPLQAMALGRPTILTAAHGHESYAPLGVGIDASPSTADYFIYGDAGEWWEPDYEQLCEAMWDVYNNYDAHCAKATASAETIARDWTWSNTADRFLELLGPELDKPYTGSGVWVAPEPRLFPIITTEDHYSEAAGVSRYFEKGRLYWDLADIKRILFDAGKLDPACLSGTIVDENGNTIDVELGLAPQQLEQLDQYLASHAYCPTCHQQLNTRPSRADHILAGVTT